MKMVIMGCGRLGSELALKFEVEGHDITVVDTDHRAFHRLPDGFKGRRITGSGYDRTVLAEAGIERCDGFIAVTNGDNHNIVGALTAKRRYRVPKVVARIFDPRRAIIYRRLGVPTVSTTTWATHKIHELVMHPDIHKEHSYGNGEVTMARLIVSGRLVGQPVESLKIPGRIEVVAITRLGSAFIPQVGTVMEEGDVLRVLVSESAMKKLDEFIHG